MGPSAVPRDDAPDVPEDKWDPFFDATEGMTAEERMGYELIRTLEGQLVTDDTFRAAQRATQELIARLQLEIDSQRVLTRYARRLWFEVLFWVFLLSAHLGDLARVTDHPAWGLVFFLGDNGAPWWVRALGVSWQVAVAGVLAKRSQVPKWLEDRLPFKAMTPQVFQEKWPTHVAERLARLDRDDPPKA